MLPQMTASEIFLLQLQQNGREFFPTALIAASEGRSGQPPGSGKARDQVQRASGYAAVRHFLSTLAASRRVGFLQGAL